MTKPDLQNDTRIFVTCGIQYQDEADPGYWFASYSVYRYIPNEDLPEIVTTESSIHFDAADAARQWLAARILEDTK